MADDGGVWAKIYPDALTPGAAKIGMSSVGVDNAPDGKPAGATGLADGSYTYTDGGKTYRVLAFTDDGRSDLALDVETAGFADVLLIGGGGGGGEYGGGGAGGYIASNAYLTAGTATVTVGAGGSGIGNGNPTTAMGNASQVGIFGALGGGHGSGQTANIAGRGGSGGGAGYNAGSGSASQTGQGNAGGNRVSGFHGAGGGGASAAGGGDAGSDGAGGAGSA